MRKRALMGLVLVAGFVSMARAQEAPSEQVPIIGETIDVRVVNVEVVATSGSGPVRGLAAGDFRLLVDGKEVPVEFFTEVENGTAAASTQESPVGPSEAIGRSYLVFIDESFSVAKARDVVLRNLERDLGLLSPRDRMAVLAFNGASIEVLCPWTSDRAVLAATFRGARQRQAFGNKSLALHSGLERDRTWAIEMAEAGVLAGDELKEILDATSKRVSPEARTQIGKTALAMAGTLRGFLLLIDGTSMVSSLRLGSMAQP